MKSVLSEYILLLALLVCGLFTGSDSQDDASSSRAQQVSIQILENLKVGTKVVDLRTKIDIDWNVKKPTKFKLISNAYFVIKEETVLFTKGEMDRDSDRALCKHSDFPTLCQWSGLMLSNSDDYFELRVIIQDVNDNAPSWNNIEFIHLRIPENAEFGYKLDFPLATDLDSGVNSIQHYRVMPASSPFFISSTSKATSAAPYLVLKKSHELDRELNPWHNLTLLVQDGGTSPLSSSISVVVEILDQNDNSPLFESSRYSVNVPEDIPPGSSLPLTIRAYDLDAGDFGSVSFRFAVSTPPEILTMFELDPKTAGIRTRTGFGGSTNRRRYYDFRIVATDGGVPPRAGQTHVRVEIKEKNTHPPLIRITAMPDPRQTAISVPENRPPLQLVASITVEDRDSGANSLFNCSLNGPPEPQFRLNFSKQLGKIKVYVLETLSQFDREQQAVHSAVLVCSDFGQPILSASKDIVVHVLDVNDCEPRFDKAENHIRTTEGNEPRSLVYQLVARDGDAGENARLRYEVECEQPQQTQARSTTTVRRQLTTSRSDGGYHPSCPFSIDVDGRVTALTELDREENSDGFKLLIRAWDHGTPPLNGSALLVIELEDVNDCVPEFSAPVYQMRVSEDREESFRRRLVGRVFASDRDLRENAVVFYRLDRGINVPFEIDSKFGTIFTSRLIDRENSSPFFTFNVVAVDHPNNLLFRKTSSATVSILVTDLNDHKPEIIYPNDTSPQVRLSFEAKAGYRVAKVIAIDRDQGDNAQLNYVIMKGDSERIFGLDLNSGVIKLTRDLSTLDKDYKTLTIKVADRGRNQVHMAVTQLSVVIGNYALIVRDEVREGGSGVEGNGGGRLTHDQQLQQQQRNSRGRSGAGSSVGGNVGGAVIVRWWEPNKIIIISILLVTAVVSCVLIGAICVMARRRNSEAGGDGDLANDHQGNRLADSAVGMVMTDYEMDEKPMGEEKPELIVKLGQFSSNSDNNNSLSYSSNYGNNYLSQHSACFPNTATIISRLSQDSSNNPSQASVSYYDDKLLLTDLVNSAQVPLLGTLNMANTCLSSSAISSSAGCSIPTSGSVMHHPMCSSPIATLPLSSAAAYGQPIYLDPVFATQHRRISLSLAPQLQPLTSSQGAPNPPSSYLFS